MRGYPMGSSLLGSINRVARPGQGLATVAIGDGGNELGMGSLHAQICEHIPLGPQIGCVVPADAPVVEAQVMTKRMLRELAMRRGVSYRDMLARAEANGLELPDE